MRVRTSQNPVQLPMSMVVGAALVAAVAGGSVGVWLASAPTVPPGHTLQLVWLACSYALTLLVHADHGEDVRRWMAGNYGVRLLVWVAFGAALGKRLLDLLRLEFVAQMRGLKG